MTSLAPISQLPPQQLPELPSFPPMGPSASEEVEAASSSGRNFPEKVDIRINSESTVGYFAIAYTDAQTGKLTWLDHGQTILSRAQIGKKSAYPTLHLYHRFEKKWVTVPGNAKSDMVLGDGIRLDVRSNGSRRVIIPGDGAYKPMSIELYPKFAAETSPPTSVPVTIRGNNKDNGNQGDVFGVTYKKDENGSVIIEGNARLGSLLIYNETAQRWAYLEGGSKDDLDNKDNGIIRFRVVVKEGHTVSLHSTKEDSLGNIAAGNRVATLYTKPNPKPDNSDGPVVLAAAAAGIAAGGAGAGAGAIGMGSTSTAATIAGAVAANNVRNPPKPKPEKPTLLELITTALSPIQEEISRSASLRSAVSEISSSSSLSRALSDPDGLDVDRTTNRPTAAELAQLQRDTVTFSETAGPVLLQLLLSLIAGGALAGIGKLISPMVNGKVLNDGNPATISIFGYTPTGKGTSDPYSAATGLGPYFGVSPPNTIASNTNFSVSFATPQKARIGGRDIGFGITLSWAIDTKEKNDTGSVGDKASYVAGAFGYLLGGRSTPPPINPPQDRKKNRTKFYIGLESDMGAQVRYRPGREHENQFIFAGWFNLLATVASLNKSAKDAPVLLLGPSHAPAKWQFIIPNHLPGGPKPNPKPDPKPGPSRQLAAKLSGFDDNFWKSKEKREDKTVRDLLKGVTLINTQTGKRHYVADGAKPRKGQKQPGENYDYDTGPGRKDPNGVLMKYRGGKNGVQHPNEVIFHLGNGMKAHVQYDNLWNTKEKSGAEPKLKKIYIHYGKNQMQQVDQNWVNANLTATFKNGTVTLINKYGNTAPT